MNSEKNKPPIRLQVYLAHSGAASRRSSEQLIAQGRVSVNGRTVTLPGEKVGPGDEVCLDGIRVEPEKTLRYLVLHKPSGYICSSRDPQGRPLARNLLPHDIGERLYSIGRLDYRSSGLIVFTNDGEFAAAVGHPRSGLEKEYLVESSGSIPDQVLEAFKQGVVVEGACYRARDIRRLGRRSIRVVLIEGKNREIRRVFSFFHLHPVKLHRIRIGPITLGDLGEGESRPLSKAEFAGLGDPARGVFDGHSD